MLLAFDTTLDICSVALLDSAGALVAHRAKQMTRGHAEALVPMIDETLQEAGVGMDALERLAVTTGPGTFTGVRVGVSAARGLALALKLPVGAITTLEMLAGGAAFSGDIADGARILATIDARRGQAYLALYQFEEATDAYPLRCLAEPAAVALEDTGNWLDEMQAGSGEIITVGSAGKILSGHDSRLRVREVEADAATVARLASGLPAGRWQGKPQALYLRPPDAKLPASG